MSDSPINRVQFTVMSYRCIVCGKSHRRGKPLFAEHLAANAKHYGFADDPPRIAASNAADKPTP